MQSKLPLETPRKIHPVDFMFCRKGRWTYHGTGVEYYQDRLFTEQMTR